MKLFSDYSSYINDIVVSIYKNLPAGCSEIHCLCEVEENKESYSSVFYYKCNGIYYYIYDFNEKDCLTKDQVDDLIDSINVSALKLYDSFIDDGQSCWDAFELHMVNGEVTGKFHYDWYKRGLGPFARRIIWAYESFGLKPKIDSYDAIVLERYLRSKE